MHPQDKFKAMNQWLEQYPEKTEQDWLLEERCTSDEQRNELREFLDFCRLKGLQVDIPGEVYLELPDCCPYPEELNGTAWFDFSINGAYYDLDTPDELYTGDSGYKQGWVPFLAWKWEQLTGNPAEFRNFEIGNNMWRACYEWKFLEEGAKSFFVYGGYAYKWSDPRAWGFEPKKH